MKRTLILAGALLVGACGNQQKLAPPHGAALPPKPATAATQPTPAQLLAPVPTIQPTRSDELLTKSQPRADDPFNMPPK